MKLIDKDKAIAGIEEAIRHIYAGREYVGIPYDEARVVRGLQQAEDIIDTLEVKETDINKEISQFIDDNFEKATIGHKLSLRRTAKHFFELGLKTQKGE